MTSTLENVTSRTSDAWQTVRHPTPTVWRLRLTIVAAGLALLAFVQQPRFVSRDTKLDLYVDPIDFLRRALSLWDPRSSFGELANQGYGYLFPMGPYYAITHLLRMPDWVAQRLWMSLLMVVAFLGVVRLAGALGIGKPWARVLAGVAFALSPRMATVLGPISSEALPFALTPWVLVPLVRHWSDPRRAGALSALVVLCAGGVNATASAALLPLPVIYLLTRPAGPHRRKVVAWWAGCVALVSLWWVVPLLILGLYSFSFLDYIEPASVTTSVTSLTEVVRGNSHWINHFQVAGQPWWRGGSLLTSAPLLYVETLVVAGLGLAGLATRRVPERTFLVLGLLSGVVLVAVAYSGAGGSLVADGAVDALDGPLAPLRNVHKFDPVLRLPLVLGLAHLVSRAGSASVRPSIAVAAVVAVAGGSYPFLATAALPDGGYLAVPAYWRQAANWLAEQGPRDRTLVVPASGFGQYVWGRPMDEPLQPLARAPWAVRNQIPLSSEGNIRALDAVEARIGSGEGSPALGAYLARMGVRFVLVRNDLDWPWTGSTRPIVAHQALERSGLLRVGAFGPGVAANPSGESQVSDRGADPLYEALEVYEVPGARGPVAAEAAAAEIQVTGGPEGVLQAMEAGLLQDQPAVLAGDPLGGSVAPVLATDGQRRRERNMGEVVGNGSETLTAGQAWRLRRAAHDYLPFDDVPRTVARWPGPADAVASSSGSDADALFPRSDEHHPGAAVDGNPDSSWTTGGSASTLDQWWELRLDQQRVLGEVRITLADLTFFGTRVTELAVRTDGGEQTVAVPPGRRTVSVRVDESTTRLRLSVAAADTGSAGPGPWGISEVVAAGVTPVERTLVAATATAAEPPRAVSLARGAGARASCVRTTQHSACTPSLGRLGEEAGAFDRVVRTAPLLSPRLTGTARPVAGPALDALLDGQLGTPGVRLTATSRLTEEPANRPGAAMDGDPVTGWVASPTDPDPVLTVTFDEPREISQLLLRRPDGLAASRPATVVVEIGTSSWRRVLSPLGRVQIPPTTTRRLALRFPDPEPVFSSNPTAGDALEILPVGVAELEVEGVSVAPSRLLEAWRGSCDGPVIEVDGVAIPTSVNGYVADLATRRAMAFAPCAALAPLAEGEHRVRSASTPTFAVDSLALTDDEQPLPEPEDGRRVRVVEWGSTDRVVEVGAGDMAILQVAENHNRGWVATADGRRLRPVRLDGWQQGYRLPPGPATTVRLEYRPDRWYGWALGAGAVGVAAVVGLALLGVRRRPDTEPDLVPRSALTSRVARVVAAGSAAALVVVGGWAAVLAMGVVAAAVVRRDGDRLVVTRPTVLPVVVLTAVGAVVVLGLLGDRGRDAATGPFGLTAQLLLLVALAAVVCAAWPDRSRTR